MVVDADEVARAVTAPGEPVHDAILARFGAPVIAPPDGTLDRAALGTAGVRGSGGAADLERLVHPAVRPWILAAMRRRGGSGAPAVVVEAIKLVEGGLAAVCDEVWLVACDPEAQRARLTGAGHATADADQRMAAQAGLVDRLRPLATRVLDTSGGADETRAAGRGEAIAASATAAQRLRLGDRPGNGGARPGKPRRVRVTARPVERATARSGQSPGRCGRTDGSSARHGRGTGSAAAWRRDGRVRAAPRPIDGGPTAAGSAGHIAG